ncbi:MAG: hypothetical protein JNM17_22905 [Archangium sp.]|nr:hypothetical protein [Archangium sp.]
MPLPASLAPTIDALLSSRALCLPLGGKVNQIWGAADRYLHAVHQTWFEVIAIAKGKFHLEWVDGVEALYEKDPSLFDPALAGKFEPIPLPADLAERAHFADTQFPALWSGLEQGAIDVESSSWRKDAALRVTDGTYWQVREAGNAVIRAERCTPRSLIWSLRSQLWEGTTPPTRALTSELRARVEQAVQLETILRARRVDVQLTTPTIENANYRLLSSSAFRWEDTGEEVRSLDWTNPWPEPVFDFLPFPRDELLVMLRAPSTEVIVVDYAAK